ncbi:hypothetical protein ACFQ60_17895 [Streptomyces zhihengii]
MAERAARATRSRIDLSWPDGLPDGGRHGFTPVTGRASKPPCPPWRTPWPPPSAPPAASSSSASRS